MLRFGLSTEMDRPRRVHDGCEYSEHKINRSSLISIVDKLQNAALASVGLVDTDTLAIGWLKW